MKKGVLILFLISLVLVSSVDAFSFTDFLQDFNDIITGEVVSNKIVENIDKCEAKFLNKYNCKNDNLVRGYQKLDCSVVYLSFKDCEIGCSKGKCREKVLEEIVDFEEQIVTPDVVESVGDDGRVVEEEIQELDENTNSGMEIEGLLDENIIKGEYSNTKNMNLFSDKNVFLISDEDWHDVLPLVPVTTWTGELGEPFSISNYPTLVYHLNNLNYAYSGNGATAEASSQSSIFGPIQVLDGRTGDSWFSLPDSRHWLLIDLNQVKEINHIKLATYTPSYDYYLTIKVSVDNVNYNTVVDDHYINADTVAYTLIDYWGNYDFDFDLQQARYIKFEFSSSSGGQLFDVSIGEVEIYNTNNIADSFDADSVVHFMQLYELSNEGILTIVGEVPDELADLLVADFDLVTKEGGAGLDENQIEYINPNDYFSYWSDIGTIVIVENDYKFSLLASSYASLLNAPLFIGGLESETQQSIIINDILSKRKVNVVLIGNVGCPGQANNCEYFETLEELQHDYIEKTGTDKLLITNPDDINEHQLATFEPEKSMLSVSGMFSRHSLVSPILASAKHELLVLTYSYNWDDVDELVEDTMNSFFNNDADYLTIVSPPFIIPNWDVITQSQVDLEYAVGESFFLAPGRIFGLTSSDVSSYIARSLFYDDLTGNIYDEEEYTAFTIGRECYGGGDADAMKDIRDYLELNGYDSDGTLCSTYPENPNGCEHEGLQLISPEEQGYLQHKQYIQFSDHGNGNQWASALFYNQIPWLDLSVTGGVTACSTNSYLIEKNGYGVNILRKGAMAYTGSIPITYTDNSLRDNYVRFLTSNIRMVGTLGYVNRMLYFAYGGSFYGNHYIMLGDPTLIPKFKYIENDLVFECLDGLDNDGDELIDLDDCNCENFGDYEEGLQPECWDGIDNDNDGYTDYPDDIGCSDPCDFFENEFTSLLCGTVITESIVLEEDLNCESDGLIIGASDITLDCNGNLISHIEVTNNHYGIKGIGNFHNVNIINCVVNNFMYGIHINYPGSDYHLISNNFQENDYGIRVWNGVNPFELTLNTVLNNNLDLSCAYSDGFYSNGENICETIQNDNCNPEVTCMPP